MCVCEELYIIYKPVVLQWAQILTAVGLALTNQPMTNCYDIIEETRHVVVTYIWMP